MGEYYSEEKANIKASWRD